MINKINLKVKEDIGVKTRHHQRFYPLFFQIDPKAASGIPSSQLLKSRCGVKSCHRNQPCGKIRSNETRFNFIERRANPKKTGLSNVYLLPF